MKVSLVESEKTLFEESTRFQVLDGWRGISILLVLATHLLPLGPKNWQLNATAGPMGMALFFTLSGFLITNFLLHGNSVSDFLIRRLFRILPLAWVVMAVGLIMAGASSDRFLAYYFFVANLPPIMIGDYTSHFWSLCVEMQFYFSIALTYLLFGKRGLTIVVPACLIVTSLRVIDRQEISIVTYYRVDEILAGAWLALIHLGRFGDFSRRLLRSANWFFILLLFIISSHPASGPMNYLRPYLAAILVGITLENKNSPIAIKLGGSALAYIATISYALYIIHPLLSHTWFGSGETVQKYLKRPLLFFALFAIAHLSTFYYERRFIGLGRKLSQALNLKSIKR